MKDASVLNQINRAVGPYPGLRPFDDDEAEIFFGREAQTDQLLEKLQRSHFIAVVGPSGCGKSSLVRAGMIAALESGFLAGTGTGWRIAGMRPGDRPLARLADALMEPSALGPERGGDSSEAAIVQAMLRRGPLGLLEILRETPLPKNSNLLILVDQFEEIFRFRRQGNADEADAFVALLLATIAQRDVPVYVVITMRSDFLGDCALFTGLPEAINDGQYLTPRLSRDQIRAAITGPARVFGGEVEPALVNHLLNEIGPDPDQLPLLQHALMRMWVEVHGGSGQHHTTTASARSPVSPVLTMVHYDAIGSLSEALSQHADHVLAKMTERQQRITRFMLTRLTERGTDKRDTRRPTRLDDVAAVSGATEQEVIDVVERLRQQGCSFLTPPPPVPLTSSTVLDIGHESLIRQWHQLYQWVEDEAVAATRYRRLAERAELNAKGEADLMSDRELAVTVEWHQEWRPNASWAMRYHPGFEAAEDFLQQSRAAHARRRLWRVAGLVGAAILIIGMVVAWARSSVAKADASRLELEAAHAKEDKDSALAESKRDSALAEEARAQRDTAVKARAEAERATREAKALSQKLLSQVTVDSARELLQEDPDRALALAVAAFNQDPTPQAKGILQQSLLARRPRVLALGANHRGNGSPDGRYVAISDSQGTVRVWEIASGKQIAGPLKLGGKTVRPFFSPNGALWGVFDSANARITILDTRTWGIVSTLQGPLSRRQFPSFSSDAKNLIAWGDDQHPRIWESATGKAVGQIGPGISRITGASFSPDGKYIAAIDSTQHASLWDAGSRAVLSSLGGDNVRPIRGARFSPDGRSILLTPVDARFAPIVLSMDKPREARGLPGVVVVDSGRRPPPVNNPSGSPQLAVFNPRGSSILAISGDTIRLWRDSSDRRPFRLAGSGAVRSARFSQDGRLILSTGGDGKATLWDVATGRKVGTFSGGSITNAWLSADSRQVLTTSQDGILRGWTAFEFGRVIPLAGLCPDSSSSGSICNDQLAFNQEFPAEITSNGKYLLARDTSRIARIWEVSTGAIKARLDTADRASFSPDGKRVITTAEYGTAKVWDVETGKQVASLEPRTGQSVLLGSFGDSNHPWAWYRAEKGAVITVWNLKGEPNPYPSVPADPSPGCVTVSPDAAWLAMCEDKGDDEAPVIRVKRLPPGRDSLLLAGHTGALIDVFFSGDSRFAASTSYDKTAMVWEVGTWRSVARLAPHDAGVQYAFFSPDSREVATIDDAYTVRVWETATGTPISELRGHTARVKVLAFSKDGPWLATGSEDHTARVWDSRTGQQIAVLHSQGPVIAVAFIPGSRIVVTAAADGTIRRHPCDLCVSTSELLSIAGKRLEAIRPATSTVTNARATQLRR